jgi:non-ribosomal peptide synthetase component F
MTLLAGFHALLGRYTGQEQLSVGTPVAGRGLPEIEPLIGFFVNTLVMRGDLSGRPTFEELLHRTRENTLAAYAHQDLPFERLVDELQVRRDISRNPLFQVMFALQDAPLPAVRLDNGLTFAPVEFNAGTAQFDVSVSLHESGGAFRGSVKYSTDLFDAGTVARFMQHYQRLLEAMAGDPQQRVFEVPLDKGPSNETGPEPDEPAGEFDFAGLGDR